MFLELRILIIVEGIKFFMLNGVNGWKFLCCL